MNPGTLREVLQLLRPSQVQDETGQRVDGWELVKDGLRAQLVASPGVETVTAGAQTVARVPTQFRIRFPETFEVNPTMRIVHRARMFQIIGAVDETGRQTAMLITADELVGEPLWLASS